MLRLARQVCLPDSYKSKLESWLQLQLELTVGYIKVLSCIVWTDERTDARGDAATAVGQDTRLCAYVYVTVRSDSDVQVRAPIESLLHMLRCTFYCRTIAV
jgi:hypothetical protein